MSEGLQVILNDEGVFEEYDDTYDLTIHCESAEEQEEVLNKLNWRWIPVSERLPEENGSYFVTVKRGYVTTAIWVGTAEFWSEVTAWMPLPEPYKASPTGCSTCILDNTDACTRGAGRAVDDEACEDYLASPTGAEGSEE